MMNFRAKKFEEIINSMRNAVWMTRSFTSHPGGNKVDGLPPASSFGPMCDIWCRGMEFLETGQFFSVTQGFPL